MQHKKAFGYCDRTGKRYPYNRLVEQYENRKPTGLRVGFDVVDIDHEQLQLSDVNSNDRQTLPDPRPEGSLDESRMLTAWNPVGGGITEFGSRTLGLDMICTGGYVTVEVS